MRLCAWAGAQGLLPVLVLLMAPQVEADQRPPRERHYYIAAEEIDWKYSGKDTNRSDPTYRKVVFREYEEDFRRAKTHPPWLGLLGPTLRAEEGETIVVTFRNMATMSLSIHPHGVTYGKQSEGASYFDNTSLKEKEDDMVHPTCEHVYYWEATTDVSPQPHDPNCLTYTYISHQNVVKDYNSGLIGTLLICKNGTLDESGRQIGVHQEYVFLFGVFDEKRSQHEPSGTASDNHVKYTINGYANGSLPDVSVCAHAPVSLHLLGMSSGPEVFSVHMNGQVLQQAGHKVSSVGLISGSTATVSLVALYTGRWLFSSHTIPHIEAGLHGFVDVTTCDGFKAPKRRLTSAQKKQRRDWRYFIAAEEVIWDYAPNMPEHIEADFKLRYLTRSTTRIGRKYKKAVYTLYKDESFTEKLETKQRKNELGILGPVIRAQIRDVITIVFKNMASRPYSIYPHGLTIEKSEEGVNYPEGGNHSHGVQPGETHTYVWKVVEDDEPLEGDSRCLTRMYHSAVDTPRDISSGLIGPMLICKTQSLNVRNVQLKADKEQHAIFSVFDENKSWYQDFNINHSIDRYKILKTDPEFYRSNVKHTINGYMFESGTVLGFCNGEVATWHVSSIGVQDYIQTATFYGHMFELHDRMEDFLSLYPMTGETITMNMDNIGFWLLASLNSHWTTRGMRVKFQDVECLRDYQYEYEYGGAEKEFTVWHPPSLDEIQVEKKMLEIKKESEDVVDYYTAKFADELGLRSLTNQSSSSDIEHLDLSFLDYDAIDVHDGDTNIAFNFNGTKNKNNAVSETKNTTIYNATAISVAVNVSTDLTVTLEETTNLTVLLPGSQTSVDAISEEDSEERLTRGAVFPYSVPLSSPSSRNCTPEGSLSNNTLSGGQNENSTAANHVNGSAGATNHLVSFPGALKKCLENVTHGFLGTLPSQNVTGNVTYPDIASSDRSNSTGRISLESKENITARLGELNHTSSAEGFSNETVVSGNLSLSSGAVKKEGSAVLYDSESSEEVLIYLKENNTEGIKTTAIKTQGHNWTYEGTHQMVPVEIPDHMMKYFEEETPQTTPAPKKKKVVTVRQWPQRGEGMKTKKKKSYKPQARSGLPFSPHGFNPGMTPRGSRPMAPQPVSNEEDLINVPVVIGLPRPDFSDYELYVPGDEPAHLDSNDQNLEDNEYEYVVFKDPYGSNEDMKHLNLDETGKYYLKVIGPNVRVYFIAAEETEWDYSGYGQRRQDKLEGNTRKTTFTKVVFRSYMDSSFTTPEIRGEIDEHLGILGPVIKAEVGQSIIVVFRNRAKRPYSIHPNGVIYAKQTEGLSYEDGSKHWYKYDNEVQPNTTFTYLWKVNSAAGPMPNESDCRTWAYYSGVNPERDIHSGLIGPLLVCRKGTLTSADTREFILLFMTFDETQSWYFENNREIMKRKSRKRLMDPNFRENLKFHSINGIIYNLKGLRMYTKQLVRWHLINMGSPKDFQTVHFHGQTFVHKKTNGYRQAVFPLLPGSFATLEMLPTKPGLWQLETEVGLSQQSGMQTLFLVLDNDCYRPLGLESGSVKDIQITAINTRGYWEPRLARLNLKGQYNAWSTEQNNSWIQVDFQRPVVISQVATQGAKQIFQSQFVVKFLISYSTDRRKWIFYKGNSTDFRKVFPGNQEAYKTKLNTFFPPLVGRFIRLHPIEWSNKATVRMEFYGCELDGCSVPLGMESGHIADSRISASSTASSWYSGPWTPSLARLNKQGTVNAWQAKYNDMNQWLQVELPNVTKITGIITQGAKSMGQAMYVMSYTLQYSSNGIHWEQYTDEEDYQFKTFSGNEDNNDHVKNYIYPPIFSRFIRIVPRTWRNSITMRIELLGCDFE